MSHNTFGHLFRVTTWGESHGPAIGCVVDGCPPGIPLTTEDIQVFLDKRRPGQSRFTTQRREPDTVRMLSGVFADEAGQQVTTGTPISPADRQCRSARQGLHRHQGQVPPGPCRFHLLGEIRHPRLSRRRPLERARDGDARGGGGHCPQNPAGRHDPRRARSGRHAQDRSRPLVLGRGGQQPLLLARSRHRRNLVQLPRRACARPAPRSARSSRSWPRACRQAGARPSTASSTRTWPPP